MPRPDPFLAPLYSEGRAVALHNFLFPDDIISLPVEGEDALWDGWCDMTSELRQSSEEPI